MVSRKGVTKVVAVRLFVDDIAAASLFTLVCLISASFPTTTYPCCSTPVQC